MAKSGGTISTNISSYIRQIRLSPKHYLYPIFETVVNSIQAIKELNRVDGKIEVIVQRANEQPTIDGSKAYTPNITGFVIQDNGIGFNEENFNSFQELATEHKFDIGCKGVGRFTALAAFASIEIESTFKNEQDGKFYTRTIRFNEADGVKETNLQLSKDIDTKTIVTLSAVRPKYINHDTPEDITSSLLRHLLIYYITDSAPEITIFDSSNDSIVSLSDIFNSNINFDGIIEEMELKGTNLSYTS